MVYAASTGVAEPVLNGESLYHYPQFWPPYAFLKEPLPQKEGNGPILPDIRGVLIRITDDGRALIDFGRHGMHDVPVEQTTLPAQARRIQEGKESKRGPNYLQMLGPPKMHHYKQGEMVPVSPDETKDWKGFIFIYLPDGDEAWNHLVHSLSQAGPLLGETGFQPFLMPLFHYDDQQLFGKINDHKLDLVVMRSFLNFPFVSVLSHNPGKGPLLVATDLEGKVLGRSHYPDVANLVSTITTKN